MAGKRRTKKRGIEELTAQADPRAPLDSAALLAAAKPVLARLEADLIERATSSPTVMRALEARYNQEKGARRTAESFAGWQAALATQVAAAWLLSCVFVRTLEDRGLLKQARIAGPGAEDSQRQFDQLAPSLTARDYLLTVFRELSHHPAACDLFDAEHSLVWKLSPSADAAKELLALFRTPSAAAPAFRFGQPSTRFLGDLYQDLSEDVRKRYALLQTPDFIESFILDRTLEPAIQRFGLDNTTLIDPTCGSGHFLLGAFDRLFEHRLRAEPGLDARVAAVRALNAVYGADINPYAVAIARFRLTLSFLEKAGYSKLADAPALPLHLVVADSLRINPQHPQTELWHQDGVAAERWLGDVFAFEDEKAARDVLFRQFAAVVGNPPYITVKDAALREVYRAMYTSAAGKYALSAPFCERFFQLARPRGYTGQITANSFMKREFGKRLIEEVIPSLNLELIVNTSGAYIPGHGTPTVLLFGTNEPPQGTEVLATLAKRGEPSTPDEPARGQVWGSIAVHFSEVGFENDYISVARVARESLAKHPWSLGGGGASELKELIEERASSRLGELVEDIGFASFTGLDDAFILPAHAARTRGIEADVLRTMVTGECVRDWATSSEEVAITPYSNTDHSPIPYAAEARWARFLWPLRTTARNVSSFGGKTRADEGQNWWEWYRWQAERYQSPFRITFAFVATHNHFVLDRGGKVFNRSAPIIKLPETATEDDHLALLAYLNSSTACFWMKQVFHKKSSASQKHHTDPARAAYEFAGTGLLDLPLPRLSPELAHIARRLCELGAARAAWLSGDKVTRALSEESVTRTDIQSVLREGWAEYDRLTQVAAYLQEELDWLVYRQFCLADSNIRLDEPETSRWILGVRPFERETGYDAGLSERVRDASISGRAGEAPSHWREREATTPELKLLESREFKRMWRDTEQNIAPTEFRRAAEKRWLQLAVLSAIEEILSAQRQPVTVRAIAAALPSHVREVAEYLSSTPGELVHELALLNSVPAILALIYSDSGLNVRQEWEQTWQAQRLEDEGESIQVTIPPKYGASDFLMPQYWSQRGKLDVPQERFISYPYCESDADGEPVYGWAGWDHLQRAHALGALYLKRRDEEGWTAERLTPMLAGLLELIPWLKQWHNEPSAEFDGQRMGDYYENFLNEECRRHHLTHDDLRAWRPPKKTRGKAKSVAKTRSRGRSNGDAEATTTDGAAASAPAKKSGARKKKGSAAEVPAGPEAD